eukprot:scaffold13701_cov22-Tisochrysis_lutea.AAC.1
MEKRNQKGVVSCSCSMKKAVTHLHTHTCAHTSMAAASLDYENIGQQALDTNLNIFVESVNNLGTPPSAALANPTGGTTTDVVLEPELSAQPAKESARPISSSPVRVRSAASVVGFATWKYEVACGVMPAATRYGWPSLSQLGAKAAKAEASTNSSTESSTHVKSGNTSDNPGGARTTANSNDSSRPGSNSSGVGAQRTVGLFKQLRNRTGSAVLVGGAPLCVG